MDITERTTMSAGKNFDLLKEAVGAWQDHYSFSDCVMNGEYGNGNRLVAWAESDALGVRFYVSDGFRIADGLAGEFVSHANAYVKWGLLCWSLRQVRSCTRTC